jgi:7-cyano-7-deazaguanine synthase
MGATSRITSSCLNTDENRETVIRFDEQLARVPENVPMTSPMKAVVLLSGGLDSATAAAIARQQGFRLHALTFRYGQRHAVEVEAARQVAAHLQVDEHRILSIDLRAFGGSALTDDIEVPRDRTPQEIGGGVPSTYVPGRNTIFFAYALAWAEVLGAADLFFGANAQDRAGYPDCRPEYVETVQRLANLATRTAVEGRVRLTIHTPLAQASKAEIIRRAQSLGLNLALTTSCYEPSATGDACGRCDACVLRLEGFAANNLTDPRAYQTRRSLEKTPLSFTPSVL